MTKAAATKSGAAPVPLDLHLCFAVYSAGMAIQRAYKPVLDRFGITYPQYLVLNVLWNKDRQTVGAIAGTLDLESSTLTPLLKRMEATGFVRRTRNPENERQVVITLTPAGIGMQDATRCLGETLFAASGQSCKQLAALNKDLRRLRDAIYAHTGEGV